MQAIVHIAVLVTLVLSFAKAPFEHTHDSDPHHEHANGISHTHWANDPPRYDSSDAPRLYGTNNSDARMLDWIPGDGRAPIYFAVDLPEAVAMAIPSPLVVRVPETASRGHDPPTFLTLSPRAPPA